MSHILITYATWTGATHQVAEAIAEVLREHGATVDVMDAGAVKRLDGFTAVVMGISAHMGKVPGDAVAFVRKHGRALAALPVAEFLVCLTNCTDTPEARATAQGYLQQVNKAAPGMTVVDTGFFGGVVLTDTPEYKKLNPIFRGMAGAMAKDIKDGRDWEAIRGWAAGLPGKLQDRT